MILNLHLKVNKRTCLKNQPKVSKWEKRACTARKTQSTVFHHDDSGIALSFLFDLEFDSGFSSLNAVLHNSSLITILCFSDFSTINKNMNVAIRTEASIFFGSYFLIGSPAQIPTGTNTPCLVLMLKRGFKFPRLAKHSSEIQVHLNLDDEIVLLSKVAASLDASPVWNY